MNKVDKPTAISVFESWLEHKKVPEKKRDSLKAFGENIVDAIESGNLILDDDFYFHLTLNFPIGEGEKSVKTLKFKPRINATMRQPYKTGLKGDDFETQTLITLCTLTDISVGIIRSLDDTADRPMADSIALFFM